MDGQRVIRHGLAVLLLSGCSPLAQVSSDLSARSEAQRHNIRLAAAALHGQVVQPGAVFSFNRVVGPRTLAKGYQDAPAFMEGDRLASVGGGICQVSSTVYATALAAGMTMLERVPHGRLVQSVPPGRDATVWYGKADLAWRNTGRWPVRITAEASGSRLTVSLMGQSETQIRLASRSWTSQRQLLVETKRYANGRALDRTLDRYRL